MKRILVLSLMLSMGITMGAFARVQYDTRGHIVSDDTIRGQKRASQELTIMQNRPQAAAAARIDYTREYEPMPQSNLRANHPALRQK